MFVFSASSIIPPLDVELGENECRCRLVYKQNEGNIVEGHNFAGAQTDISQSYWRVLNGLDLGTYGQCPLRVSLVELKLPISEIFTLRGCNSFKRS